MLNMLGLQQALNDVIQQIKELDERKSNRSQTSILTMPTPSERCPIYSLVEIEAIMKILG